jgi:hypothetical protein
MWLRVQTSVFAFYRDTLRMLADEHKEYAKVLQAVQRFELVSPADRRTELGRLLHAATSIHVRRTVYRRAARVIADGYAGAARTLQAAVC